MQRVEDFSMLQMMCCPPGLFVQGLGPRWTAVGGWPCVGTARAADAAVGRGAASNPTAGTTEAVQAHVRSWYTGSASCTGSLALPAYQLMPPGCVTSVSACMPLCFWPSHWLCLKCKPGQYRPPLGCDLGCFGLAKGTEPLNWNLALCVGTGLVLHWWRWTGRTWLALTPWTLPAPYTELWPGGCSWRRCWTRPPQNAGVAGAGCGAFMLCMDNWHLSCLDFLQSKLQVCGLVGISRTAIRLSLLWCMVWIWSDQALPLAMNQHWV